MENISLKYAKERGSFSFKIQELIKFPDDGFKDERKKQIYLDAKYCHRNQHGIMKVSQYFFNSKCGFERYLKRNGLEVCKVDGSFDYAGSSREDTRVWYMNFASNEPFNEWDSPFNGLEESQVMLMPLLYKVNRFLHEHPETGITPYAIHKEKGFFNPTPILFESVPQWMSIDENCRPKDAVFKEKWNNIVSMMAPVHMNGGYSANILIFIFGTLMAGFGGIQRQGKKCKKPFAEVHTGNWGCGNFGNNKELMYLCQMLAADLVGIKKLYFHRIDEAAYDSALKKFNSLINELSFAEIIAFLDAQGYGQG